jgi:hypothetical protein
MILPDFILEEKLRGKKTSNEITKFCLDYNEYCNKNEELVCDIILKLANYTTYPDVSSCGIHAELERLYSKMNPNKNIGTNYLRMTSLFLKYCDLHCSYNLRSFLYRNRYPISKNPENIMFKKLVEKIKKKTPVDYSQI